jgi:glycosyltransferase involved in cell wall biosynthesis
MRFSVVIPTRSRPAQLAGCLEALTHLDYDGEFEVVVVDDRSSTPLDHLREMYATRLSLTFCQGEGKGPARARNVGAHKAQADFLVFTDDDCRPVTGWLRAYDRALQADSAAAWGGEIVAAPETGLCGSASQLLIDYLYGHADSVGRFFCSNNLAVSRQAFLALGGFDGSFELAAAEDREFCDRWGAARALRFSPDAVVVHHQAGSIVAFCRQHFRYGRGAFHYRARRRLHGLPEIRRYPAGFWAGMILFPFRRLRFASAAAAAALLLVSQTATAAGYVYERSRVGRPEGGL